MKTTAMKRNNFIFIIFILIFFTSCSSNRIPKASQVNIQNVSDSNFHNEVVDENKVVVVDFWAPWCGPCKDIDRIMRDLSRDFPKEEVKFVKLNIDENEATKLNYEVMGLPTIIIFKNGKIVHKQLGLTTREHIRYKIQEQI